MYRKMVGIEYDISRRSTPHHAKTNSIVSRIGKLCQLNNMDEEPYDENLLKLLDILFEENDLLIRHRE